MFHLRYINHIQKYIDNQQMYVYFKVGPVA